MKIKTLLLAALSFTMALHAQPARPVKIYPITREMHELSWYKTQAAAWENETKTNPKNADAWFNYFRATRYTFIFSDRTGMKEKQLEIAAAAAKTVPDSWQYNLMEWYLGGLNFDRRPFLEKAYQLNPDAYDVIVEMTTVAEVENRPADRKKYTEKWLNGEGMSDALLAYNYNVLMSLEPDAILFTCGDNDTYPLWLLQDVRGVRTDVTVFNISLLGIDGYRNAQFKKLGITAPGPKAESWPLDGAGQMQIDKLCVKAVLEGSHKRPVYFAISCGEDLLKPYESKLYLTGLANKYSEEKMDNMAVLRKNFEQLFLLDHLRQSLASDRSEGVMALMNQNYLTPLLTLYSHYETSGETTRKAEAEALVRSIAKRSGRESEILQYLGK